MYYYVQQNGGEETWQPIPADMLGAAIAKKPQFTTVLRVSQIVDELSREDRDKLKYLGPMYFDWDYDKGADVAANIERVTEKAATMLLAFETMGLDMASVRIYATGGKGYHAEIPMECFMSKPPKSGIPYLAAIYKKVALDLAVDTLDLRVYSGGRGRMWRTPNVQRSNGRYKVPITWPELIAMTPDRYIELTSQPREFPMLTKPAQCAELTITFDKASQEITSQLAKRKKKTSDTSILKKVSLPSLKAMMEGRGIKGDTGFHQLSLQLGIIADNMGWDEDKLVAECAGLITAHQGDGRRYNTEAKRREELVRMHRYTSDNPCYEFSVGAVKSLLNHDAPDLDGIPIAKAEIEENIAKATEEAAAPQTEKLEKLDEYDDVSSMVDMTRYGIYIDTEHGKKRICALSFDKVHILRDITTGQVSCYEAEVLVNGRSVGRQTLELDMFSGLQSFNRFCGKHAHAMQGLDQHVRAVMLRVAQRGQKEGNVFYVAKREGLDVIQIPGHENERLRRPFLVWSDARGVITEPGIAETGVELSFQGFPDPRGQYRTDIADAPRLGEWIGEGNNKDELRRALRGFFECQRPDVIGNMLGWYTACFFRMLFHKAFEKFPLLHVNGSAGAGKSELNLTMLSYFYYNQEPKSLTPQSTIFAIQQHMAGSASIPLMIDEYKPHEMPDGLHNKLKLLWRDAYNNRDVMRGGGTRDNDDYRALSSSQLTAPVVFIGEVMEEEPATMERVVLVTIVRPPSSIAMDQYQKFQEMWQRRQMLGILGQHMAAGIVATYSVERLQKEFNELYNEARGVFMLTAKDIREGKLSEAEIREKQGAKERTIYNFSVSKFGLLKFKEMIDSVFGPEEFAEKFADFEENIFKRLKDLLPATQAEYLKVFSALANMSFNDPEKRGALIQGQHYAIGDFGGKPAIEMTLRTCYHLYRIQCREVGYKPLFSGDAAFLHAMKDSTALMSTGPAKWLMVGGTAHIFDLTELTKMGVDQFKG